MQAIIKYEITLFSSRGPFQIRKARNLITTRDSLPTYVLLSVDVSSSYNYVHMYHDFLLCIEVDTCQKNTVRPLHSAANEHTLIKILQFGRELKLMNNRLNETEGTNEGNNIMLEVGLMTVHVVGRQVL